MTTPSPRFDRRRVGAITARAVGTSIALIAASAASAQATDGADTPAEQPDGFSAPAPADAPGTEAPAQQPPADTTPTHSAQQRETDATPAHSTEQRATASAPAHSTEQRSPAPATTPEKRPTDTASTYSAEQRGTASTRERTPEQRPAQQSAPDRSSGTTPARAESSAPTRQAPQDRSTGADATATATPDRTTTSPEPADPRPTQSAPVQQTAATTVDQPARQSADHHDERSAPSRREQQSAPAPSTGEEQVSRVPSTSDRNSASPAPAPSGGAEKSPVEGSAPADAPSDRQRPESVSAPQAPEHHTTPDATTGPTTSDQASDPATDRGDQAGPTVSDRSGMPGSVAPAPGTASPEAAPSGPAVADAPTVAGSPTAARGGVPAQNDAPTSAAEQPRDAADTPSMDTRTPGPDGPAIPVALGPGQAPAVPGGEEGCERPESTDTTERCTVSGVPADLPISIEAGVPDAAQTGPAVDTRTEDTATEDTATADTRSADPASPTRQGHGRQDHGGPEQADHGPSSDGRDEATPGTANAPTPPEQPSARIGVEASVQVDSPGTADTEQSGPGIPTPEWWTALFAPRERDSENVTPDEVPPARDTKGTADPADSDTNDPREPATAAPGSAKQTKDRTEAPADRAEDSADDAPRSTPKTQHSEKSAEKDDADSPTPKAPKQGKDDADDPTPKTPKQGKDDTATDEPIVSSTTDEPREESAPRQSKDDVAEPRRETPRPTTTEQSDIRRAEPASTRSRDVEPDRPAREAPTSTAPTQQDERPRHESPRPAPEPATQAPTPAPTHTGPGAPRPAPTEGARTPVASPPHSPEPPTVSPAGPVTPTPWGAPGPTATPTPWAAPAQTTPGTPTPRPTWDDADDIPGLHTPRSEPSHLVPAPLPARDYEPVPHVTSDPEPRPAPRPTVVAEEWPSGVWASDRALARERGRAADVLVVDVGGRSWHQITALTSLGPVRGSDARLVLRTPMLPARGATLQQCSSGAFRDRWTTFGRHLAELDKPVIVDLGTAMNEAGTPWAGDPESYASCFGEVARTVKKVAPQVAFQWTPVVGSRPGMPGDSVLSAWPGADAVDVVGVEATADGRPWSEQVNGAYGLNYWAAFADRHGKRVAVARWGVHQAAGQDRAVNPSYVRNMHDWVGRIAAKKALAYEVYTEPVDVPKEIAAAYRDLF